MGWGGVGIIPNLSLAPLLDLHLHLHVTLLDLHLRLHVTLLDLHLHLHVTKLASERTLNYEACNHSKGIFCIKKKKIGANCWCIQVGLMECGKFPRVPSRARGALVKKELSIHNYCKAFAFGSGDGTMEIVKISWPSLAKP